MRNITIINGHPSPSRAHLNYALADAYERAARAEGARVRRIDLAQLDIPLLREPEDFVNGTPSDVVKSIQDAIREAHHLVVFSPLWMNDIPATLKGVFEQVFRPGFAMGTDRFGLPKGLLVGKSARIVMTMGMPVWAYNSMFGAHAIKLLRRLFRFAGVAPVETTLFGGAMNLSQRRQDAWFARMACNARADARAHGQLDRRARMLGLIAIAAGTGYAMLAVRRWLGLETREHASDDLLDAIMPHYDTAFYHETVVAAPAVATFEVLRNSDFERSAVVRSIFRARELFMHAGDAVPPPHGRLVDLLPKLGWGRLSDEPTRLVLGAATQPWLPNPVFRPLGLNEFTLFSTPGFVKIALMVSATDIGDGRCVVMTETRVACTDEESRRRFRAYWALVSPGAALIRRVLLDQVKRDAEAAPHEAVPATAP